MSALSSKQKFNQNIYTEKKNTGNKTKNIQNWNKLASL